MPTTLTIDREARMVYSNYYGDIVTEELVRHIAAIRAHPEFNPEFRELIDATQVTSFSVSTEEVRDLAIGPSPFAPSSNRVFVASDDLIFGLARMFQTFGGEIRPHFAVVRTLQEAYRRLGLDPGFQSSRVPGRRC